MRIASLIMLPQHFRQARQVKRNCEKLCNELVKRNVYRNYRIVIEKEKGGDAID